MKTYKSIKPPASYLDLSEYMIKEHSPLFKPTSPKSHLVAEVTHILNNQNEYHHKTLSRIGVVNEFILVNVLADQTPEIGPIDHDPAHFVMTPIAGLLKAEIEDIMEEFMLDGDNNYSIEIKEDGRRRSKKIGHRETPNIKNFQLDNDLQRIIEDEKENSQLSYSQQEQDSQQSIEDERQYIKSSSIHTFQTFRTQSRQGGREGQEENNMEMMVIDYSQNIERFNKNPKKDMIKKIKEIQFDQQYDESQKRDIIKKHLEKYLLDHQIYCYEESWKELNLNLAKAIDTISKGIEETFNKKIGSLAFEVRRVKLLKYLEKKKKRIWRKKVNYDCRKKVADGRLRIKGKFVTREQACEQLGMQNLDNFSAQQIKEMLERKMEESLSQYD